MILYDLEYLRRKRSGTVILRRYVASMERIKISIPNSRETYCANCNKKLKNIKSLRYEKNCVYLMHECFECFIVYGAEVAKEEGWR